jgi:hypothetical protein
MPKFGRLKACDTARYSRLQVCATGAASLNTYRHLMSGRSVTNNFGMHRTLACSILNYGLESIML